MSTNLETQPKSTDTKTFFNQYYTVEISYPANEVDAVVSFFTRRGFEKQSAISVATALLQQAKFENVPVFEVLDTLKGLDEIQISKVVADVINANRPKTSAVGLTNSNKIQSLDSRNILP